MTGAESLRKILAWLALLAMGFGAAAPTVSRYLRVAEQTVLQIAVCDEHGMEQVDARDGQALAAWQDPAQRAGHGSGHPADHPSDDDANDADDGADSLANPPAQGHHHGGTGDPSGDAGDDCCAYCTLIHHCPFVPVAQAAFALHAPLTDAHHADGAVPAPALRAGRKPHIPRAPPFARA